MKIIKKKTVLSAFIAINLLPQIIYSQTKPSIRDRNKNEYIWVASHRGDWIYAPENSTLALEHAVHFGVDIMETDVRLTKDGEIITMHDTSVDRTTNGHGLVSELTLAEIKKLRLRNTAGPLSKLQVPTLEEFIKLAHGKILLYFDKAGDDLPGHEKGEMVKEVLKILKKNNALQESVFVLDWSYSKAREIFGEDLEKVIYCPVIEDKIPNLSHYVDEYLRNLKPVAFQFRIKDIDSQSYKELPKVINSGSKAFVAATWPEHTANHDDLISIFKRPSEGWGWLIDQGFSILETNYPRDLIYFLKNENRRN